MGTLTNRSVCCVVSKVSQKNVEKPELNCQPSKGVRAKSHLETKNFSAYRNWTADIQPDLFEGGTQYTLKLVIHNLIFSRKVISIDFLIYRRQSFAYGREIDGKPTEIDSKKVRIFFLIWLDYLIAETHFFKFREKRTNKSAFPMHCIIRSKDFSCFFTELKVGWWISVGSKI